MDIDNQCIMNKICITCGSVFYKSYSCSRPCFEKRKFCSSRCGSLYRIGKPTRPMPDEIKVKVSIARTGKTAGDKHPMWKGGQRVVSCKTCGKTFCVDPYRNKARYCSRLCKTNDFNKGKTDEHERVRKSKAYKDWRKAVFERDGYKCVECGSGGYLHADHIKPFAAHSELRLDVNNGRTLCVPCHKKTPTFGRRHRHKKAA